MLYVEELEGLQEATERRAEAEAALQGVEARTAQVQMRAHDLAVKEALVQSVLDEEVLEAQPTALRGAAVD